MTGAMGLEMPAQQPQLWATAAPPTPGPRPGGPAATGPNRGQAGPIAGNVAGFGQQLHRYLYRPECFASLDCPGFECGWRDGGCRVLAQALHLWLGAGALGLIVNGDAGAAGHVVYQVGRWLLDGDGVSTAPTLLRRWRTQEGVSRARLARFDPGSAAGIPTGAALEYSLAAQLQTRFDRGAVLRLLLPDIHLAGRPPRPQG